MKFVPFDHARFLGEAWVDGAPDYNLGSSGFMPGSWKARGLPGGTLDDIPLCDLNLVPHKKLQERLATRIGVEPSQITLTAGTSAANLAVALHAIKPGSHVLCERPFYAPMPGVAQGLGARVEFVDRDPLRNWAMDWERFHEAGSKETDLIVLSSRNNPTGRALNDRELAEVQERAEEWDALVMLDIIFSDLETERYPCLDHDRIIVTSGVNKAWGAPALRLGWIASNDNVSGVLGDIHRHAVLAPSALSEQITLQLLDHEEYCRKQLYTHLAETHALYDKWVDGCPDVEDVLAQGLTAFPRLVGIDDTEAFCKWAIRQGLLALPGEFFGLPGHIRVGLGAPKANVASGLEKLAEVLPKYQKLLQV